MKVDRALVGAPGMTTLGVALAVPAGADPKVAP
jgi:hypothetical protein